MHFGLFTETCRLSWPRSVVNQSLSATSKARMYKANAFEGELYFFDRVIDWTLKTILQAVRSTLGIPCVHVCDFFRDIYSTEH